MKKIMLSIVLLLSFIYAETCHVQNLKTQKEVEDAQQCMIRQLKELDKYFERYENYHSEVESVLKKLIAQEGNCKKWELLYKRTQNPQYSTPRSECQSLYDQRVQQFKEATAQFRRISKQYDRLKESKEALELKEEMLKNTADLLGTGR